MKEKTRLLRALNVIGLEDVRPVGPSNLPSPFQPL